MGEEDGHSHLELNLKSAVRRRVQVAGIRERDCLHWKSQGGAKPGAATARVCLRQGCSCPGEERIQGRRDVITMRNLLPLPLALESPFESTASSLISYVPVLPTLSLTFRLPPGS